MALKAKQRLSPQWYTPESQKDEQAPARFKWRPLDAFEENELENYADPERRNWHAGVYGWLCRTCLVDWENVQDENAQDLRFASSRLGDVLTAELVREIGLHILLQCLLTEDEVKNSSSQSRSPETERTSTADDVAVT